MSRDIGLLVLRVVGLGLALAHGWAKIVTLSTGQGGQFVAGVAHLGFPLPLLFAWAAALSEFLAALCVAAGFGTRIAAGFSAFTMAVAAIGVHHAPAQILGWLGLLRLSEQTLKGWGNPELALLYLAVFVALILLGPGRFSLDTLLPRKRK